MNLLVWNIRQGGGPRRHRIADCIQAHNPDLVALVEFVPGSLPGFIDSLGLTYQACTVRCGDNYAVCVLARTAVKMRRSGIPILDDSGLWLEVGVPEHRFGLGVIHAPTRPRSRMREFLSAVGQIATARRDEPFLFVGDFNTGIDPLDGPMKNYGDVDRFGAIQSSGFRDVWRKFHGDLIEHSYAFPRTGKSYRIDHALASESLLPRIRSCDYSHAERSSGVSDHSVLLLEIDLPDT